MRIEETNLHPPTKKALDKAGFVTLEELPDDMEKLTAIKGVGEATAKELLDLKKRTSAAKGPHADPDDEIADEVLAGGRTPEEEEAEELPVEEDPEVYPTARWSRYHLACIAGLDRHMGRMMERWAYAYITHVVAGNPRTDAAKAAGLKGAIQADKAVEAEVLRLLERFGLQQARTYGPPPGNVAP